MVTTDDIIEAALKRWPEAVCITVQEPAIYWEPDEGSHYYPRRSRVFFSVWRHNTTEPNCVYMQGYFDSLDAILKAITERTDA